MNRHPKLKITDLQQDLACFELSNTDISMANTLRRIMIAEVPTFAIENVEFDINTSAMQDEYIAHRLGLIPLRSLIPMASWNYIHACDCDEGCDICTVKFSLDVQGPDPSNTQEFDVTVTSRDLIPHNGQVQPVHFSNEEEEQTAHGKGISIIRLGPGQRLKLRCIAIKGIGKEHAKWSPAATIALKCDPIVKLNEDILDQYTEEQKNGLVDCCPSKVFGRDDMTGSVTIVNMIDCIFCKECIYTTEEYRRKAEDKLAVEVIHSQNKFYFTVETNGSLHAKELVKDGLNILMEKITYIQRAIPKLKI